MKRSPKRRHYIEALLIYALPLAMRPLPFALRIKLGGAIIGFAIRHLPPLKRRILHNLGFIYPHMPPREKHALLKRISRHIGRGFMVIFYRRDYTKNLKNVEMAEDCLAPIETAHNSGQPVILVSGHFGEWEAIRALLFKAGLQSASIYREASNPIFDRHFVKSMSADNMPLFPTGLKGMRQVLKYLKSGGIITMLLDQRVNDGIPLDFMGKPALSSPIMAELAIKTGALLLPVYAPVLDDGRVKIIIEPPIKHSDPITMTKALNDSLSAQVRAHPAQWYWLHKRWARPDL